MKIDIDLVSPLDGDNMTSTGRKIVQAGFGLQYNMAGLSAQRADERASVVASLGGTYAGTRADKMQTLRCDATGLTAAVDKDLVAELNLMLETYHAPLDALLFVDQRPLDRSSVWAHEYEWYKSDFRSEAIVGMTLDDTEVPSSNASVERFRSKFINFKAGYHWNLEDMQGKGLTRIDVILARQKAARDAVARAQNSYILFGSLPHGIRGLFNNLELGRLSTSASPVPSSTDYIAGGWAALATGTDVNRVSLLADIGKMYNQQESLSLSGNGPDNEQLLADTLILPLDILRAFEQTPFSSQYKDRSVLEEIQLRFPRIKTMYHSRKLTGIGVGDTNRALFFKKSVDTVHLVAPIMYEEIPAQFKAFSTKIHAFGRFGQVDFLVPASAIYVDGI